MEERGRARERAQTWPPAQAAPRRHALLWPIGLDALSQDIRDALGRWAAAEVAPGRLLPWLPVAFATGIILYFAAEREPSAWAAVGLFLGCMVVAILVRRRPAAFPLALGAAALVAGFATACLRSAVVAHPVLQRPAWNVALTGWVEVREERDRSDRIVVRVERIDVRRGEQAPARVRVSVRKGAAPPVGAFVELKARLNPPMEPLRPGGYDFARDLYFQSIASRKIKYLQGDFA